MSKLIQFRTPIAMPADARRREEPPPSLLKRTLRIALPAAAVAGTLYYAHKTASKNPTPATRNPLVPPAPPAAPVAPVAPVAPAPVAPVAAKVAPAKPVAPGLVVKEPGHPDAGKPLGSSAPAKTGVVRAPIKPPAVSQLNKDAAEFDKVVAANKAKQAAPKKPAAAPVASPSVAEAFDKATEKKKAKISPVTKRVPQNNDAAIEAAAAAQTKATPAPKRPTTPAVFDEKTALARIAPARRLKAGKVINGAIVKIGKGNVAKLSAQEKAMLWSVRDHLPEGLKKVANDIVHKMGARVRPIQFNTRGDSLYGQFGEGDGVLSAIRKGQRLAPWISRARHVGDDLSDAAEGRKVQRPFWKRAWFRNLAVGAALGAPLLARQKVRKWDHQAKGHVTNPAKYPDISPMRKKLVGAARNSPFKGFLLPDTTGFAARVRPVNFAKRPDQEDTTGRKVARRAGLVAAGLGVATLPAALPMLRAATTKDSATFVSNYLKSGNRALNFPGVGAVLQRNRLKTKPGTLKRFMADHYTRFRAGPKESLGHWGFEVGESLHQKAVARGKNGAEALKPFLAGQKKVNDRINQGLWKRGLNESEAIDRALRSKDGDVRHYVRDVAVHKRKAARNQYAPIAAASPALAIGGAALYAANRKKKEDRTEMSFGTAVLVNFAEREAAVEKRRRLGFSARVRPTEFGSTGMKRTNRVVRATFGKYRSLVGVEQPHFGVVAPVLPDGSLEKFRAASSKFRFKKRSAMLRASAKSPTPTDFLPPWSPGYTKNTLMRRVEDQHARAWRKAMGLPAGGAELSQAVAPVNFAYGFKRAAGVTIVGKPGQTDAHISNKLARIATRQPQVSALIAVGAKLGGTTPGAMRDAVMPRLRNAGVIGGTVAAGAKGKRAYVNRATVSGPTKSSKLGLREIVHHEKFHNLPVVGRSEIAAHFVGGLRSRKGKLSIGTGLNRIGHLIETHPSRFAGEAAVLAGSAYVGGRLIRKVRGTKKEDRPVNFAYADALDNGWDLRDARGRSARVYAPGSRRRQRREKDWGEKVDNIRRVRNIAIGAAAVGLGGTGYLALRNAQLKQAMGAAHVSVPKVTVDNLIPFHHPKRA